MCFKGCPAEDRMGFCQRDECPANRPENLVWEKDDAGNWLMKPKEESK